MGEARFGVSAKGMGIELRWIAYKWDSNGAGSPVLRLDESRKMENTCCSVIEKNPERLRSSFGKRCPLAREAVTESESKDMESSTSLNPSQRDVSGYWHLKNASLALKMTL